MRSFPSYMRRVAMLASIAILWVAIASGAAPLLHHGGGAHAERCDDARTAATASSVHGADCEHRDAHDSEGAGAHCPVCRGLQHASTTLPQRAPRVVPGDLAGGRAYVPPARNSGRDSRIAVAARGPPRVG